MNVKACFEVFTLVWLMILFCYMMHRHGPAERNPPSYGHIHI